MYTWDHNTYYDQSPYHFYQGVTTDGANFSGVNKLFADWQSQTGFDAHSTYQQSSADRRVGLRSPEQIRAQARQHHYF